MIATSIMFDTLGMVSDSATSRTIEIISQLVKQGVSLAQLDEGRRLSMKKSIDLVRYKADLMKRIEYHENDSIASIVIPWEEIEKYSEQYNPSMLVLDEMRMTEGVKIAVAFKTYPDGKITAKLRANFGYDLADKISEHFGGGGHPYAAGFKVRDRTLDDLLPEFISIARENLESK